MTTTTTKATERGWRIVEEDGRCWIYHGREWANLSYADRAEAEAKLAELVAEDEAERRARDLERARAKVARALRACDDADRLAAALALLSGAA